MGKPYADDLRLVVVRLIEEGHTRPEVAELCGISLSSVGRYVGHTVPPAGSVQTSSVAIRTMRWRGTPTGSSDGLPSDQT